MENTWNNPPKKKESVIPSNFDDEGVQIDKPSEIAHKFNTFFTSIGSTLERNVPDTNTDPLSFRDGYEAQEPLELETITQNQVIGIINDMNLTGAGVDGINVKLLKKMCPYIIPEITHLMHHKKCISKMPENCTHKAYT